MNVNEFVVHDYYLTLLAWTSQLLVWLLVDQLVRVWGGYLGQQAP